MKKRALAVMLAGALTLGAQTGVWAASDTSDQKEGELTLLMLNNWIHPCNIIKTKRNFTHKAPKE